MASTSMNDILLPGMPIPGLVAPLPSSGKGTYLDGNYILASTVGRLNKDGSTVTVTSNASSNPVPEPNSVVIGTITRLTPQQATVAITVVDGRPTGEEFQGVVRVQDIRLTERDKLRVVDSFRLGDTVRAVVISLGDARSYYLSTARNDLGVLFANSEAGAPLTPISWQEMTCSLTGKNEKRKVAKPDGI
ncbi:hypothetical protein BDY24DRAFT_375741 [Mrakia frigida]|uniref:exosome non-catalytic core subunit CSL4 n=1 Tax=Mrakia frigida TaxID=29902 RepID=UPI003FCBEF3E